MLQLKPNCEHCGKLLPNQSQEAMICSFECTFCKDCVENVLENICPNCGGGLTPRPIRPAEMLKKYPATTEVFIKPVDPQKLAELKKRYAGVEPHLR
jgi:hypothetical protein